MVCTLMLSRHLVIRFGGIGVTTPTVGDGTMAGDGIVLTGWGYYPGSWGGWYGGYWGGFYGGPGDGGHHHHWGGGS